MAGQPLAVDQKCHCLPTRDQALLVTPVPAPNLNPRCKALVSIKESHAVTWLGPFASAALTVPSHLFTDH